ncbi:MAG: cysteine hydrolase [Candidatus Latescibacteria bacterium]|nr:cysteine hydrolase [Candidatus Latescibacterota bacterium]
MNTVIIVDMLNGFCKEGALASPRLDSVTPHIVQLLDREQARGSPLIFLVDTHEPDDAEFQMFPPHCVRGTRENNIIDELKPFTQRPNATVIPKSRYSGFYRTDLESVLEQQRPERVIVCGVCTDICVLHTVADLRNRNYPVDVVRSCVETYDLPPDHPADRMNEFALTHMRDILGARVVD